ncbi:siroheme synthase CysG [Pelagibius sp. 7325]|uniref:siroheme synthase CysG n=1 Tax=Pelagibius sp. 7325 TaxID=3131994 RepID=UPI0030EDAE24
MSALPPPSETHLEPRPAVSDVGGRARIDPLAVLPVFFSLRNRSAVVVGGSAAAAWKAELLAAAGARIVSVASLEALRPDDLAGAALAVADIEGDTGAARFAAAARAAGVPCNVIDKPAFCDFQFGAIVNRSPVVVGISTGGAAPVLGQAIRRRIETLLPDGLAAWAAAAQACRAGLKTLLPSADRRRAFWRSFAELAFTESPSGDTAARLRSLAGGICEDAMPGVTLVGAGPGDAGLLTLNAVRALQGADVILFDDLVSDEVLALARREARRMLVGKRGGRISCKQEEINALMVKLARQGKRVVRLKGGDPMIFGRAGEEIAELKAAGIPVTVVPGITAAIGAAARLGVSLTHRDCAQSLQFVTAHSRMGGLPNDIDWQRLADPRSTLMLYMGARTGPVAAAKLVAAGLAPETPAVVMTAVSHPGERIETLTLEALAMRGEIAHEQPVLIGIGQVFAQVAGAAICPAPVRQRRAAMSESGGMLARAAV